MELPEEKDIPLSCRRMKPRKTAGVKSKTSLLGTSTLRRMSAARSSHPGRLCPMLRGLTSTWGSTRMTTSQTLWALPHRWECRRAGPSRAEPSRDPPPPLSGRALVASASSSTSQAPRSDSHGVGLFEAEELIDPALPYRVSLEQLASELHVAEWSWLAEPEQQNEGRLKLRFEASGLDLRLKPAAGRSPSISLRGFLGTRELRFDVLVMTGQKPGLLLGRDVLAEGFLVDPTTPEPNEPVGRPILR